MRRIVVNVDGGSRGNPGPAAIAAVVADENGEVLTDSADVIGIATNNVAEYKALLLGIELARELGADEVEFVGDSELIVKQVRGEYKVKKPDLKPLHKAAVDALGELPKWSIRNVPRELNEAADALVNEALDAG
jgi:ribonuclease HI